MGSNNAHKWYFVDLGVIPYPDAWGLQLRLVAARSQGRMAADVLLLLEHPAVFTLGRRGGRENLLVSEAWLGRSGIEVVQIERGGNITYHGPGQLVVYPIVHLPSRGLGVVDLVDRLEEVMIRTCADWGVAAGPNALNRGAWVGMKKIGSIGIAVRRGVSFHGLALNVNLDLKPFGWIQPCGLEGVGVTSIQAEAGKPVGVADAKRAVLTHIEAVFQTELTAIDRRDLWPMADPSCREAESSPVGAGFGREIEAGSLSHQEANLLVGKEERQAEKMLGILRNRFND
jgi:lipoate-protein ligase B